MQQNKFTVGTIWETSFGVHLEVIKEISKGDMYVHFKVLNIPQSRFVIRSEPECCNLRQIIKENEEVK
jgi:hypothetical protein